MSDKTCSTCRWWKAPNPPPAGWSGHVNEYGICRHFANDRFLHQTGFAGPVRCADQTRAENYCREWQASDKAKSEPAQVNPGDTVTFHNLPESAATNDSFVFSVFTVPHDPPKLHSVKMSAAELTASLDQFTHKPGNMMPGVFDRLRGEGVLPAKTAADQGAKGGEA